MALHVLAHVAPAPSFNVPEKFIHACRSVEFAPFLDLEMAS
jgi:hypothetical protein